MPDRLSKTCLAFTVMLFVSFGAVRAQEVWESIPYEKWGKKEIKKVTSDSPWAKVFRANINLTRRAGANELSQEISALVMLRSALPVRQALYRQRQINEKYDAMSADRRSEFEKRNLPVLECPSCKEYYSISIVSISQSTWEGRASEELSKKIYLSNEKGDRRYLLGTFAPGDGEMIYLFPRLGEDREPLLTTESKKLIFTSELPQRYRDLPVFLTKVEFDVTKIIRNGKVEF